MRHIRIIPCLLLRGEGLVKTIHFSNPRYVGDPVNIAKIFCQKEVDELILLDIMATKENRGPAIDLLKRIIGRCFMPICYGGGVSTIEQMQELISIGIEKIALNSVLENNIGLLSEGSRLFGQQCMVASIDVCRHDGNKYQVYFRGGSQKSSYGIDDAVRRVAEYGAGEILLTSIDREGSMQGLDLDLIERVTRLVSIPVIAHGGASTMKDFIGAEHRGAAAVAAGSMFVFHGPLRAVLISYPTAADFEMLKNTKMADHET